MDGKKKIVSMGTKPRATLGRVIIESKKPKPVCDRKTTVSVTESRKLIGTGAVKKANNSKESTAKSSVEQVDPVVDLPCPELSSAQDLSNISDTPTEDSLKAASSSSSNASLSQPVKPKCIRPYPTVATLRKNDPKAAKLDQQLNEFAEKTLQKSNIQKGLAKRPLAPPIAPQSKRVVPPAQPRATRPATLVKEPSASAAPIARPPTRRVVKPSPSSPPAPVVRTVSNNNVIPSPAKRSTSNGSTSGVGKKKDIGSGTKNVPVDGEPSTPRKGDESFAVKVFHKKQSKSPTSEPAPVKPCKLCGLKTEPRTNDEDGGDNNKENELELEVAQNRIMDLEIQVKHLEEQLLVKNEEDSIVKDEAGLLEANLEYAMNRITELEKENEVLVQRLKNQEDVFQREMDATVQDCAKAVKSVDSFWDESKRECEELKKKYSELEMKNSDLQMQLEVLLQPRPFSTPSHPQTPTDCTGETLRDFTNTVNESSLQVPVRVPVDTTAENEDLNAAQSENRPVPSAQIIERSHVTRSIETDKENRSERESNASKKITGTIKENQKLAMLRKASGGSIRNGLLAWCQSCVEGYRNVSVTNFSTSFADGLALCALIHSLSPSLIDMNELSPSTPMKNYETAVAAASMMGVGVELDIKAIVCSENPPWETILSYIVEIYNVHTSE